MPLRILSYNILTGGEDRLPLISDVIRQQQPLREQPHVLVGDLNTIHPLDEPNVSAYLATLRERGDDRLEPQFPRQVIPLLLEAGYWAEFR